MNLNAQTNTDGNYFLERRIDRRTGSRVHNLCVEAVDDRIVVHGFADSYYAVQLAIAAIQEATQTDGNAQPIELDIQVANCPAARAH